MSGKARALIGPAFLVATIAACHSPPASQTQTANVSGGSNVQVPVPSAPQNVVNAAQPPAPRPAAGNVQPPSPEAFVASYASLLQAHKFDEAYKLLDPSMNVTKKQFEQRLAPYKTIHAAVGKVGPTEGAAGSLYATVQLTLSGEKKDGAPYTLTGPITLRRVNNVPGSTPEQRQWHIYKMDLSSNPKTAEQLVNQTQGGRQ
jgi:hypothetical protein